MALSYWAVDQRPSVLTLLAWKPEGAICIARGGSWDGCINCTVYKNNRIPKQQQLAASEEEQLISSRLATVGSTVSSE